MQPNYEVNPQRHDPKKEIGAVLWVDNYDANGNVLPRFKGTVVNFSKTHICISLFGGDQIWYDDDQLHLTATGE